MAEERGDVMNDAIDLLRRLIAFDTTSAKSNMDLISFVADYLRQHQVRARLVHNDGGDKASLFATVGPEALGGVVLSGHTDVVPVSGQDWRSDPFELIESAGRLHGRGTADMKGFIAVALAMVPRFRAGALGVPIHIALSHDEEVGCLGAPALIARLVDTVPRPALAIIGEPSEMKVANAHRGISTYVTSVRGRPGHASAPDRGINAIAYAARCITFLDRLATDLAADLAAGRTTRPNAGATAPTALAQAENAKAGPTTINVGKIEGGAAVNIIAEHCRFAWECRPAPGQRADDVRARLDDYVGRELLPRMRAQVPEATIASVEKVAVPCLAPEPDPAAETLALRFAGDDRCGTVPFASEAGLFQLAGIPAVVCGPGSFTQAHQPNEYVTRQQLGSCIAFMEGLVRWAAADNPRI